MRPLYYPDALTDFGKWIRTRCRQPSNGLAVTNLDYVMKDFKRKRIMMVEEKTRAGCLGISQKKTFILLDSIMRQYSQYEGYEYWGFYLLQFGKGKTLPDDDTIVNGVQLPDSELIELLNMDIQHVDGMWGDGLWRKNILWEAQSDRRKE